MLRIIKGSLKIEVNVNEIKTVSDTSDGVYFKFLDDTELIFTTPLEAKHKHLTSMINGMNADEITLNFNDLNNFLSIG